MSVTFKKPSGMKYTDMAIYIDAHLKDIVNRDENPEVEKNIFEYLYDIVFALARKKKFFIQAQYYDDFALYSASELFMALRKKYLNAGTVVRGKEIVPIKSSLNYIKATLYPLKVDYQKQAFRTVIHPEHVEKDTSTIRTYMRYSMQDDYRDDPETLYGDALKDVPQIVSKVLEETPFRNDNAFLRNLYVSVMLTFIKYVMVPNKAKRCLVKKAISDSKTLEKVFDTYDKNINSAVVWHLDSSYESYVQLLVTKVKKEFSKRIKYYLHADDLTDEEIDNIMESAYSTYEDRDIGTGE